MITDGQLGGSDCEALSEGLIAQPINAVTSLAFVVAGVIIWFRLPADQRWRAGGGYALLVILIGLGSVLYHGPQTVGAKPAHDLPIPGLIAYVAILVFVRWRGGRTPFPGSSGLRWGALVAASILAPVMYAAGRTGSPLCDPDRLLQLHGIWHVSIAVAFAILAAILFNRPSAGEQVSADAAGAEPVIPRRDR